jgi:hypothetical protein
MEKIDIIKNFYNTIVFFYVPLMFVVGIKLTDLYKYAGSLSTPKAARFEKIEKFVKEQKRKLRETAVGRGNQIRH